MMLTEHTSIQIHLTSHSLLTPFYAFLDILATFPFFAIDTSRTLQQADQSPHQLIVSGSPLRYFRYSLM